MCCLIYLNGIRHMPPTPCGFPLFPPGFPPFPPWKMTFPRLWGDLGGSPQTNKKTSRGLAYQKSLHCCCLRDKLSISSPWLPSRRRLFSNNQHTLHSVGCSCKSLPQCRQRSTQRMACQNNWRLLRCSSLVLKVQTEACLNLRHVRCYTRPTTFKDLQPDKAETKQMCLQSCSSSASLHWNMGVYVFLGVHCWGHVLLCLLLFPC